MSQFSFENFYHSLALGFVAIRVSAVSIDDGALEAMQLRVHEQSLRRCGAKAAALANLKDTADEAPGEIQQLLQQGYDVLSDQINEWSFQGTIPPDEECTLQASPNTRFSYKLYRLDGVDSPRRRVNWRFRITHLNLNKQ